MSYYMTNVIISPTLYEEKRLEAISYFSRCSREAALRIHKKNKYKDIKLRLNTIVVAIIEAKKRYFDDIKENGLLFGVAAPIFCNILL